MATGDWHKPPNLISLFRGGIGAILAILSIYGILHIILNQTRPSLPLLWFQIAIVVGVISDKVDGVLARRYHWGTSLGKILERNMDGFFIFSAVLFEVIYLNFPIFLLYLGIIILLSGLTVVLCTRLIYKKWFIDDYISTKIAPGFAYLLLILHALSFSFVLWFDYLAILVGLFTLGDFLLRHHRWLHKTKSRPN